MFPESKVTEIYCMADDFCKEFTFQQEKYMVDRNNVDDLYAIYNDEYVITLDELPKWK